MKREETGVGVWVCVSVCVGVCVGVRSINLCTDFSLNAWTLSGPRAEWFWNALVKPLPAQDTAQVLSSAVARELPPWADAWVEGKEIAAQSLLAI